MNTKKYCLLIGNTRWHWAIQKSKTWVFAHTFPKPTKLQAIQNNLSKWAAVGPIPNEVPLDNKKCIRNADIPLKKLPKWIGVDRALAGWKCFEKAKTQNLHNKGILVADAGTILSMTYITANQEFGGGQLMAGLKLQRSAMYEGTEKLPKIKKGNIPSNSFPKGTEEAMLKGSFQCLLSTLIDAQQEAGIPLWLCGGDSEIFFDHLKRRNIDVYLEPNLVLEAMVTIK